MLFHVRVAAIIPLFIVVFSVLFLRGDGKTGQPWSFLVCGVENIYRAENRRADSAGAFSRG